MDSFERGLEISVDFNGANKYLVADDWVKLIKTIIYSGLFKLYYLDTFVS